MYVLCALLTFVIGFILVMENVVKIASYICDRYQKEYSQHIDEMKLHKLLYLLQRESIIETNEPLFKEQFEAWKYGPVLFIIHQKFHSDDLHEQLSKDVIQKYRHLFDKVFDTYAVKSSWSLSSLTHGEYSWQKARIGCSPYDACDTEIKTEDIRVDARRVKNRRAMLRMFGIQTAKR